MPFGQQRISIQNYFDISETFSDSKDAFCTTDGEAVWEREEGAAHLKKVCKKQGFKKQKFAKNKVFKKTLKVCKKQGT